MCGMFLHAYVRQWPTEEIIVKMYQANYLKYQRDQKSYKIRRFENAYTSGGTVHVPANLSQANLSQFFVMGKKYTYA